MESVGLATIGEQMCTADGEYHALTAPVSISPLQRAVSFVLALALSFGSHASTQALAPAESALAELGVSPLGYAALTVSPIVLGLVSPLIWGRLWDRDKGLAFVIAPAGETLGAVGQLHRRTHSPDATVAV